MKKEDQKKIDRIASNLEETLSPEAKELFAYLNATRGGLVRQGNFLVPPEIVFSFFREQETAERVLKELLDTGLFVFIDKQNKEITSLDVREKIPANSPIHFPANFLLRISWEVPIVAKTFAKISEEKLFDAVCNFDGCASYWWLDNLKTAGDEIQNPERKEKLETKIDAVYRQLRGLK